MEKGLGTLSKNEERINMTQQKDLFGNIIISEEDNVYLSNKKQKDLSNDTKVEYCLEIICKDEKQQEEMFNELTKKGFICRVLTL
jgi:hypothetical protein